MNAVMRYDPPDDPLARFRQTVDTLTRAALFGGVIGELPAAMTFGELEAAMNTAQFRRDERLADALDDPCQT